MPTSTIIQFPDPTVTINAAGVWAVPWFNAFLPVVYFSLGVVVGTGVILLLIAVIKGAFGWFIGNNGVDVTRYEETSPHFLNVNYSGRSANGEYWPYQ